MILSLIPQYDQKTRRSTQAGFLRWRREIKQKGLKNKAKRNNEMKLLPAGILPIELGYMVNVF